MDPNANLLEQERLLVSYRDKRTRSVSGYHARQAIAARLNELRKALDEWLANDGFEPDWSAAPNAAKYYGK